MFTTIKKTFTGGAPVNEQIEIRIDPVWGYAEFPAPGEFKKSTLPLFVDPEDEETSKAIVETTEAGSAMDTDPNFREYWMPDRLCKVCYCCEDPFTMFRRRHHCRMCGQVFCNQCSSYYIDGSLISMQGLVRCCKLCHEQMLERNEKEVRLNRRKLINIHPDSGDRHSNDISIQVRNADSSIKALQESAAERAHHIQILQSRASMQVEAIVNRLVSECLQLENANAWKAIILNLVREVVSAVDPNVREGDSIDIRNYVKLKIIPGGSLEENVYIDGVVFRKNVSHKKMITESNKVNPSILLLAGGIDFQRMDSKLSSMDTIIDQEDKYMSILVDKIMSFKPDIILVGKSVARRAQELLCNFKVVVMQNVKQDLLERIARMTGAKVLSSTDHMFQQFSQEILGTCGNFFLRTINDDPEKNIDKKTQRILANHIARGSTYAYMQGCPSEKGCCIILRGASRDILKVIHRILSFSIIVAYHLRLEAAFLTDRCAMIPPEVDDRVYDDDSDDDSHNIMNMTDNELPLDSSMTSSERFAAIKKFQDLKLRKNRYLLSTSLDVDIKMPYTEEIRGLYSSVGLKSLFTKSSPFDHETLIVTSLLMGENVQRTKADVMGIRYYTSHDMSLGRFLIENCFNMQKNNGRENSMLDQTLSFIHRPGRIDITVSRNGDANALSDDLHNSSSYRRPLNLPITMSSFCKECRAVVTPEVLLSDETWKMSFGKFLEFFFYNRSARCRTGGCHHFLRDNHILIFGCENHTARFEFVPMHPYSLHMRASITFPDKFHIQNAFRVLKSIPVQFGLLAESFRKTLATLAADARDIFVGRGEELHYIMLDIHNIEAELKLAEIAITDDILQTISEIPKAIMNELFGNKTLVETSDPSSDSNGRIKSLKAKADDDEENSPSLKFDYSSVSAKLKFPNCHKRDAFLRSASWNSRINAIGKYVETVKDLILQQNQQQGQGQGVHTATAHLLAIHEDEDEDHDDGLHSTYTHGKDAYVLDMASVYGETPQVAAVTTIKAAAIDLTVSQNEAEKSAVTAMSSSNQADSNGTVWVDNILISRADKNKAGTDTQSHPAHLAVSNRDKIYESTEGSERAYSNEQDKITTTATSDISPAIDDASISDPSDQSDSVSPVVKPVAEPEVTVVEATPVADVVHANEPGAIAIGSSFRPVSINMTGGMDGLSPPKRPMYDPTARVSFDVSVTSSALPQSSSHNNGPVTGGSIVVDPKKLDAKPQIRANRITKALARFVMGKDNFSEDEKRPYEVNLAEIGEGRLGLPHGMHGEVIAIKDDEPGTIIAYSLASSQYCDLLQEYMGEDYEEKDSDDEADDKAPSHAVAKSQGALETNSAKSVNGSSADSSSSNVINDSGFGQKKEPDVSSSPSTPTSSGANFGNPNDTQRAAGGDDPNATEESVNSSLSALGRIANNMSKAFSPSTTTSPPSLTAPPTDSSAAAGNSATSFPTFSVQQTAATSDDAQESSEPALSSTFELGEGGSATPHGTAKLPSGQTGAAESVNKFNLEKQLVSQRKSHIKHRFEDKDDKGNVICKLQCQAYWATQFEALRSIYLNDRDNEHYIRSLSTSHRWVAQGGKSGASFSKTLDDRFVVKVISKVEMQMFLEFAPAYFEYQSKAFFHSLPTVLCKIMGVYTIGYHNRETGKKVVENVVVMENIFYQRKITRVFDLKGSSRARYMEVMGEKADSFDEALIKRRNARRRKLAPPKRMESSQVLLDDNLMELTKGRPFPLKSRSKIYFNKAVTNDTLFLSMIDVVDYSILVGFDEDNHEVVVGIIDYMRKYDIIKRMERVGKSVGMLTGQAEPTIIQPAHYRKRFSSAMDKYFMTVPDKWLFDEGF